MNTTPRLGVRRRLRMQKKALAEAHRNTVSALEQELRKIRVALAAANRRGRPSSAQGARCGAVQDTAPRPTAATSNEGPPDGYVPPDDGETVRQHRPRSPVLNPASSRSPVARTMLPDSGIHEPVARKLLHGANLWR